ncbi:uncharacterized protein MONOS_13493 [Monocercomonoides exilis]|uniref:uncharacterized protein n=1 Tax=Monocercomonoides exilis TaxID=2049356 RepID=UPI003559E4D2|nr:hypothetical protein MONOS_13493 [Monocercomonoides exilis]|eukprot:MONOS_13493.1-p1 / transcript=MONOS_13493.1 / gene=MONOS_13493 / organism=Monocercomonoides_exilis_PA203 / gene_product=unspecified product / transcript_product=unspecified product / location=Mono_scaffold00836:13380-14159(+) / protein_length=189 / sequence_SO=supercontig / SO=protein_coding / is_pseudo=false
MLGPDASDVVDAALEGKRGGMEPHITLQGEPYGLWNEEPTTQLTNSYATKERALRTDSDAPRENAVHGTSCGASAEQEEEQEQEDEDEDDDDDGEAFTECAKCIGPKTTVKSIQSAWSMAVPKTSSNNPARLTRSAALNTNTQMPSSLKRHLFSSANCPYISLPVSSKATALAKTQMVTLQQNWWPIE